MTSSATSNAAASKDRSTWIQEAASDYLSGRRCEKIDAYFDGYRRIPDGDDPDFIAMEKTRHRGRGVGRRMAGGARRCRRGTEHGEIWWAAADKRRPVLVVSRDDTRGACALTTVAPITRTARGLASEVELDQRDGLPLPCVANCDELARSRRRVSSAESAPDRGKLAELDDALRFVLVRPRLDP